jgi:DNA-binding response OmpR family regulator
MNNNIPVKACVLVADDQPSVLRPMQFLLRQLGVEVLAVTDGASALKLAVERHPQLVFLDVNMPQSDGFETCRAIRQAWGSEHQGRIWFMTACGSASDEDRARQVGADRFITKPFDPDKLLNLVREVLQGSNP